MPAALAGALCELLGDPVRRAELSRAGRAVAAAYDWSVVARRILAVYETVVPAGGGEVTAPGRRPGPAARHPGRARGAPLRRGTRLAFGPVTTRSGCWVGAALLLLLLAWTAWTLTRLRRLEGRVARAWTALDTQLQRRAGLAETLCRDHAGALGAGPAARLAAAAAGARAPAGGDRELAENLLGRELRELPARLAGVPPVLLTDLRGTTTRIGLARRFYNDAVRDTRTLRRARVSRALRLHGRRPLPRFFDIDDGLDEAVPGGERAGLGAR